MMIIKTTITPASPPFTPFRMKHSDNSGMTENIIILNLFYLTRHITLNAYMFVIYCH